MRPAEHADNVIPAEAVERRHVARGGWRRALLGFLLGAAAGLLAALVLPRDEGPRRGAGVPDLPAPLTEG